MNEARILDDLAAELSDLMLVSRAEELPMRSTPLISVCVGELASANEPLDASAVQSMLNSCISAIEDKGDRDALTALFLGGDERWTSLATRGERAAKSLGISYDGLRRRGSDGQRRLDHLVRTLARSIEREVGLELALYGTGPPPGIDAAAVATSSAARLFLSYARADDEHERGLVSAVRDALVSEFRFQTGQLLEVFKDVDDIALGENWRRRLDAELGRTSMLLVFLTPSYLASEMCRSELRQFLERETELGRDDLILTVYYADIGTAPRSDELAARLLDRQFADWRQLRFESIESVATRRAIAGLAEGVLAAVQRTTTAREDEVTTPEIEDGTKGLVELLAQVELALPRYARNLRLLASEHQELGEEVTAVTERMARMQRANQGSAARLVATRKLSTVLEPFATRMETIASQIRADLEDASEGMTALTDALVTSDEADIESAADSMTGVLSRTVNDSLEATDKFAQLTSTYSELSSLSSTLRPVLGRLAKVGDVLSESTDRFASWLELVDDALEKRRSPQG